MKLSEKAFNVGSEQNLKELDPNVLHRLILVFDCAIGWRLFCWSYVNNMMF